MLLKEGSVRLENAIKNKNFAEAETASALIDGGNKNIETIKKPEEELKRRDDIAKKRGRSLITELISIKKKKSNEDTVAFVYIIMGRSQIPHHILRQKNLTLRWPM